MRLNPDKEIVALIKEGLKRRNGHCPCMVQQTEETKCPCKEFRESKVCACGLYISDEKEN
jgi:ferredoxin-thioredoxin reductase catalytic subunit